MKQEDNFRKKPSFMCSVCCWAFAEYVRALLKMVERLYQVVENVFCEQRGSHGQNDNPTYLQYADGMPDILLGQSITTLKSSTGDVTSFQYCNPVLTKTRNDPKPPTTAQNHPQPPKTTHDHPRPAITTNNQPKFQT